MSSRRAKVLRSIETADGGLCVDIFERDDGSFGFEEYRKDPEDPRGWYPVGGYAGIRADDADAALNQATARIAWLAGLAATVASEDDHK